jgi:hypothetical protein
VCPECFAPLTRSCDDRESCGHGYSLEDQPAIVRYLETLATSSFGELGRGAGSDALAELRKRATRRGERRKGGVLDLLGSLRSAWEHWFGFDQPLWRRAVGYCVVIGVPAAIVLPFSLVGASAFVWVIGFALVGARALAKSRYRAKHGERGELRYKLLAGACGFLALVFPTKVAPMIGSNLPTETLFLIGEKIPDARTDTFSVLASRPLSAKDQARLADAMLPLIAEWARGGWTDRSTPAWHVGTCIATGALPPSYLERLADALGSSASASMAAHLARTQTRSRSTSGSSPSSRCRWAEGPGFSTGRLAASRSSTREQISTESASGAPRRLRPRGCSASPSRTPRRREPAR